MIHLQVIYNLRIIYNSKIFYLLRFLAYNPASHHLFFMGKHIMHIKVKKTHPDAIIPQYATDGAACFDLHAVEGGTVGARSAFNFNTGLAFEIPQGHTMLVYSRSGHGFKHGLRLCNSVGVVDADYRGTVAVKLVNDSPIPFFFEKGDRIAQAMVIPVDRCELEEVEELSETVRGENGLGSTGNQMRLPGVE